MCISCHQHSRSLNKCQESVRNFFDWYENNIEKINGIDLVKITSDNKYRVQFSETEKYLSILKESRLFSEKFLKDKADFFNRSDIELMKSGQDDNPAAGFEADLLLCTQEPENLLKDKKILTFEETASNGHTLISVKWYDDIRVFILDSTDCLIDSIYLK